MLQLHPDRRRAGPTPGKALVCEWEDGTTQVLYRGQRIGFSVLSEAPQKPERRPKVRALVTRKPAANHPWRQGYPDQNSPLVPRFAATPLVGARPSAPP
jgi:hypothetical protein